MTDATTGKHHLELSVFPTSPYYARVHVQRVLEGWRRDDLIETVQLVISELVSNAIKAHAPHASPPPATESLAVMESPPVTEAAAHASPDHIWMDLYPADDTIVLRVWDASRTPPVLRTPDLDDEGGRGLCLVDLLARSWGYYRPATGGKIVWCTLAASPVVPEEQAGDHRFERPDSGARWARLRSPEQ